MLWILLVTFSVKNVIQSMYRYLFIDEVFSKSIIGIAPRKKCFHKWWDIFVISKKLQKMLQ